MYLKRDVVWLGLASASAGRNRPAKIENKVDYITDSYIIAFNKPSYFLFHSSKIGSAHP